MTTTVLAYIPSPAQGVWHLGPIPIRAYALCIIAGIVAALLIGDRRWTARGGEPGVIYDIALWAVPFGLIGGRLYHVMTDWKTYFGPGGAGPAAALRIWEGGLGIWGAVALGAVGAWIACRRRGIPLPAFGDAVAPGIVLAQAIGRLGNYFNQELYGRETTVPWGLEIFYRRDPSGVVDVHSLDGVSTGQVAAVVHPTFLYELLWNLLVFAVLLWADRKYRLGHGRLFALYVALYCVGRFWIELMRDDAATHIAGIRINVFTATFVFIGAVVYMLLAPKGREDPASLRGKPVVAHQHESLTEELAAVAKGSGLIAAATVAGEHEAEDALAVGDVEVIPADSLVVQSTAAEVVESDAVDTATQIVETETSDGAVVVETGEVVEAVERSDDGDADDTIVVYSAPVETDTVLVYESADEPDSEVVVTETVVTEAAESEAAESEAVVTSAVVTEAVVTEVVESEAVVTEVVESEAVVTETVVIDSGDAEVPESDTIVHDAVVTDAVSSDTVVIESGADDSEAVVSETVVSDDPPADAVVVVTEAVVVTQAVVVTEAEAVEAELAPGPKAVPAVELHPEPKAESASVVADDEAPKLGSTFKRLLWGAGKRD